MTHGSIPLSPETQKEIKAKQKAKENKTIPERVAEIKQKRENQSTQKLTNLLPHKPKP